MRTTSRTDGVMDEIRGKIANRALAAGDRLPSIRGLAGRLGVSPSTVVEAYDRLAAEGIIRARRGSGFFVSAVALPPLTLSDADPQRDRAVDPFWVSRQSLDATSDMIKPGCGWLPADWMPTEGIRRAFRSLARADDGVLADYVCTRGSIALRRLLLARLAEDGIEASADQIMLTGSGSQAIDLLCRYFLRPGDAVVVDDPCYFNFRAMLRAHQAKAVSVPFTRTGPDVEAFEAMVATERPRLYLTNSALHNPTGATITPAVAHRLLNIAAAHEVTIVEDEIFADFEPEPSPRMAALDGLHRVIRIGSFSKTLSASIRCGYIAGRRDWIEDLVDLQVAMSFGGPSPIAAEVIVSMLTGGGYRGHMNEIRQRLARARRQVANKLEALGIEPWLTPRGGFYLWCRLPEGLDAADVSRAALDDDVVLAPGNVFSVTDSATSYLRFNVAQTDDPRVWRSLSRIVGDR